MSDSPTPTARQDPEACGHRLARTDGARHEQLFRLWQAVGEGMEITANPARLGVLLALLNRRRQG